MDSGASSSSEQMHRLAYQNVGRPVIGLTEAALVSAMQLAAPERDLAWREFHKRHGLRLMGFIIHVMGPERRSDCEDIFQEMVIRIEKGLSRYKHQHEGSFHSWCITIAHNLCRSAHRVKAGQPSQAELISFDELEERIPVDNWDDDELASTPSQSPREEMMAEAFAKLTPVDQAVIHFRFIAPISDSEIARQIKKPVDHIRKIRNKALNKLKRYYELIDSKRKRH